MSSKSRPPRDHAVLRVRRPWIMRAGLVAVVLAIALLLEAGARLLFSRNLPPELPSPRLQALAEALFAEGGALLTPGARFDAASLQVPGCAGEIRVNSSGMRMDEEVAPRRRGVPRIACIGDSVTFGWCAAQECSYPAQLAERLARTYGPVEVLNLGVPGARSERGVRIAVNFLPALAPDVVVIAYGWNDAAFVRSSTASTEGVAKVRTVARRSAVYRALLGLFRPAPAAAPPLPARQSTPAEMRRNVRRIVRECRGMGAVPILADLDLTNSFARDVLEPLARELGLDLVRGREAADAGAPPLPDLPALAAPGRRPGPPATVLLRALGIAGEPPPTVVGEIPELGALDEGAVALHDDGRGGDEVAGDGVHSVLVRFAGAVAPAAFDYAFLGERGRRVWRTPAEPNQAWPASFTVFFRAEVGQGLTVEPVRFPDVNPHADVSIREDPVHLDGAGLALLAAEVERHVLPLLRARAAVPRPLTAGEDGGAARRSAPAGSPGA